MITRNQTKRGIIYEKIAMREDDDERMINYECPYIMFFSANRILQHVLHSFFLKPNEQLGSLEKIKV